MKVDKEEATRLLSELVDIWKKSGTNHTFEGYMLLKHIDTMYIRMLRKISGTQYGK